jgi:hypothetical protein
MMAQLLRRKKETRQRHVGFTRHTEAHDFLRLFLHVHVQWLGTFHGRIFKSGVREFCETGFGFFFIVLTVLRFTILGKWPSWRTILFYVFISIHYLFRATSCSSSGESIVSIQPLLYVTLCRWSFRVQVSDQRLYWYNWFSWWWARGCSKQVVNWNKYIGKNCTSIWSFAKGFGVFHCREYQD